MKNKSDKVILAGKKAWQLNTKWRGEVVETSIFDNDRRCKPIVIVYGETIEEMRTRQQAIAKLLTIINLKQ